MGGWWLLAPSCISCTLALRNSSSCVQKRELINRTAIAMHKHNKMGGKRGRPQTRETFVQICAQTLVLCIVLSLGIAALLYLKLNPENMNVMLLKYFTAKSQAETDVPLVEVKPVTQAFIAMPLPGEVTRYTTALPLTFERALHLMQDNEEFRTLLTDAVRDCGLQAVYFETPPITATSAATQPFEFILKNDPMLGEKQVDLTAFADKLNIEGVADVITFKNRAGDADFVVPHIQQEISTSAYVHIAIFLRLAPKSQIDSFWQLLASTALARLDEKFTYISTSGKGPSFLHLRLDSSPKYYTYQEYRDKVLPHPIESDKVPDAETIPADQPNQ